MRRSLAALLVAAAMLGGCVSVPREGPTASDIQKAGGEDPPGFKYAIVDLSPSTVRTVANYYAAQTDPGDPLPAGPPIGALGPGDQLSITLWEASQEGLFNAQGKGVNFQTSVASDGTISVPYAGRMHVAGRPASQVESMIVSRLETKTENPQASVLVVDDVSNTVFAQGDVVKPGRYILPPPGYRLLDLIALAGGPRDPDAEVNLHISRGGSETSVDLLDVLQDPTQNIWLAPGDRVLVTKRHENFYAFGAVNHPGEQPFETRPIMLLEALGKISGLEDARADAQGVFIFRHEPSAIARKVAPSANEGDTPNSAPVVYRINMSDPDSLFMLSSFPVEPGDVIYVANAPLTDWSKFMQLLTGFASFSGTGANLKSY